MNANCVWVYKSVFCSRRRRFLSLLSASSNCQPERALIFFFFLKMAIKRGNVTSCCELQACCLVFPHLPCCLKTIMALWHLLMFDTLFNFQLLKEFEKNKYRRNKHPLYSLTPSQSVTSGVWNHRFIGRGETLQRTQKKNMGLYKLGVCMYLMHSAA